MADVCVNLLEAAPAALGRDLGESTHVTYPSMIRAACDELRTTLDMPLRQFVHLVSRSRPHDLSLTILHSGHIGLPTVIHQTCGVR